MSALRTGYPALICRRAKGIIRRVDRRAAGGQCMGLSRTAVARQRTNLGIADDEIASHRKTGRV
jgi:hypothetical protein